MPAPAPVGPSPAAAGGYDAQATHGDSLYYVEGMETMDVATYRAALQKKLNARQHADNTFHPQSDPSGGPRQASAAPAAGGMSTQGGIATGSSYAEMMKKMQGGQ